MRTIEDTAQKGSYQIVVLEIKCTSSNKIIDIPRFSNFVERLAAIPDGVDPAKETTAVVLNKTGIFSHVPATVTVVNGRYYAPINGLINSTYLVIEHEITVPGNSLSPVQHPVFPPGV
ncbi:MAG: hypothetical protein ACOWWO_05205 [Peptococcaceae bacterium]